ncbi:MAG: OmpA family protein, partial [Gemmatimonadales bacterium]
MTSIRSIRQVFAPSSLAHQIRGIFAPALSHPTHDPAARRAARQKHPPVRPRRASFAMEPMEPRMLLSSDLVFTVAAVHDIRVESDSTDISIVDVATDTAITTKAIADTSAVRIVGSAADDTIRVDLTTDFDLSIFITDTGGSDTLEILTADAVQWTVTANDAGSSDAAGGIRFSSIENLVGAAGNRDTFLFDSVGDLTGSADGGTGGFDTVMFASAAAVTLTDASVTEAAPGTRTIGLSGFEAGVVEAPSLSGAFSGMTALTTGLAQWISQGPGPITGAQPRIPADNNPVTGAVQDVALSPNDLSSLFLGTVGGGVWKNSDISVLFDTSSAVVEGNAVAEAKLTAFADFLKANPTLTVQVVGHTDNTGIPADNQTLSVDRANAVRTFLIGLGIDGARLVASGQGQNAPVDTNATEAGKANNRRVELRVNHWIPLTDEFPSLSISALAISPLDSFGFAVDASTPASDLVVFAATGSTSSGSALFDNLGASTSIGILKSIDGGTTWRLLDQLAGSVITSIQVLASGTVVVSTNAASGNGLFVSTDGGENFTDVAAARAADGVSNDGDADIDEADEVFFDRAVSDLAKDPGNPQRVYAAVPHVGVFVSNDEGLTWTALNNAALTNVANAKRIVLTTSPTPDGANHPLYVALIGDTQTLTANAAANALSIQVAANTVIDGGYGRAVTENDTVQIWGSGFDGVDNDGDGLVDAADPAERPATATDGIDNDGDGLVDAEDPAESGLFSRLLRVASVGPVVGGNRTITFVAPGADGLDNNNDGNVDEPAEAGLAGGSGLAWGAGASIRVFAGAQNRLFAIFRTDDVGLNFAALPEPGTTDGAGGFHGVNSGAQGDTHFAMVVDPANPDVLYVGGDAQPMTDGVGNQARAVDFGGRWLRFDGAANWQPITDIGANNTAPHADSRNTLFRGIHMVEVDDGGIYELRNAGTAGAGRTWHSLNADLTLAEFYSLAYDPARDLILGGLQDNGDALQGATDSVAWNAVAGGDGSIVGFSNGNPIYSSQSLGGFTVARAGITAATAANATVIFLPAGTDVRIGDTVVIGGFAPVVANVQPAGAGEPANSLKVTFPTSLPNPLALGTIAEVQPPLAVAGVAAGIQNILFTTPFAVNRVTPTSLLIGTHGAYETSDVGRNLTLLGTTTGTGSTDIGEVHAIVYGGVEGGANKANVIWLGTNPAASSPQPADTHALWLRNATSVFGDPMAPVQSYTDEVGTAVMDIAVDPTDWRRVYVLDTSGRIWFSPNAGQAKAFTVDGAPGTDKFWRELTAEIGSLPGAFLLQQILAEQVNGKDVVLVGGQGGVFRRIGDGPWHEYGVGLPNALTTVLERVGGADDLLLQGSFGRGAWTLDLASQTLATPTELTIKGTSGNDEIVLRRNGEQPWLLDVFLFADGQPEPGVPSYSVPFANLTKITIDVSGAGSGNDDILIDGDFGSVVTSNGTINVIGGGGSDTLTITPTLDPSDVVFAGTMSGNAASGSVMNGFSDGFGDFDLEEVTWTGLTSVNGTVVATPTVEGVAEGLKALSDALNAHLGKALQGQSLAGIDADSLARALNGLLVEKLRPKEAAFVSVSQVSARDDDEPAAAGGEEEEEEDAAAEADGSRIQIDNGSSVLLRLLQAGGFDLSLFQGGTIIDPAALEAALEALDDTPDNTSFEMNPAGGDPSITDDLLFLVHADDLELEGVVELDTLGALELTGLLDVSMTIDLDLAFGFDSHGFFIRTTGAVLPTITITDLEISGESVGLGTLGFLGVEMSKGTLTLGTGVELKFTLGDPATVDDNLIRIDELLAPPNPRQLVTFTTSSGDATPDLVLNATLDVAPILPGVPAFSFASADIKVSWSNIADPLSASAPQVGVTPGSDVAEFLRFVTVSATQVVDTLTDLKDNLEALYGAEIPYLSDTLTDLVDLVNAFEDKVLDPLTGGANFELPSIQALVRNLSDSLGVAASQFGLAYDKVQHELTYHLKLTETLFQADKALGAGFDLAGGLADLEFHADAKVSGDVTLDAVIGLDLDLLATLDAAFFLRNASVKLDVDVSADDIEATARFGFLSIGIDEGTLTDATGNAPANITLTVSLLDPSNDGKTTLAEILGNLDELGTLIGVAGGGSVRLMLPVETSFLPGLGDIPDGNPGSIDLAARSIIATLPDLASPSSFNVILGPAISLHVGNFKNIDAAGVVGALGQLTFWFDQFRNSPTFA